MEAALGTAIGTLQREWYWTRALDARAVGVAVLLMAGSGDGVQWLSQGSVSAVAGAGAAVAVLGRCGFGYWRLRLWQRLRKPGHRRARVGRR